MTRTILKELRNHAPFTVFGALTGIFFQKLPKETSFRIFYVLHPLHVVLSALVTASIYEIHECEIPGPQCFRGKCNLWKLFRIGYLGSIGIATLSDSVIPYQGEVLLGMPNRGIHIGFIENGGWSIHWRLPEFYSRISNRNQIPPCRSCFVQHMGIFVSHHNGGGKRNGPVFYILCSFFF